MDVDQQAVADHESGVGQCGVRRGCTLDGDRLEHLVGALAAEGGADEVLDGWSVGGVHGDCGECGLSRVAVLQHRATQNGIDTRLVSGALASQPREHVGVDANRGGLFDRPVVRVTDRLREEFVGQRRDVARVDGGAPCAAKLRGAVASLRAGDLVRLVFMTLSAVRSARG